MDRRFSQLLLEWKKPFLRDQDLVPVFQGEKKRRYDAVTYALKKGILLPVKRGLYLIGPPFGPGKCDPFELAELIYGPSYISFESALAYHGWIPEAVFMITSASAKRSKVVETTFGTFRYSHTPQTGFFLNVERVEKEKSIFLIAEPWKAIADAIYSSPRRWKTVLDLSQDLRIEVETIRQSDLKSLKQLSEQYQSKKVRTLLAQFVRELA